MSRLFFDCVHDSGGYDAEDEEYPDYAREVRYSVTDRSEEEFYGKGGYFHETHADEGGCFARTA